MKPLVLLIVGPTACGKSKLALWLCGKLKAEIISADSMQIYKGMDVGTAKPSARERKKIRHHLVDIVAPSKNFSVYDFRTRALKAIRSIIRCKKVPVIVGGTGLYVRSLVAGLTKQPGENPELRADLEKQAASQGLGVLYQKLNLMDPIRAAKIKPTDQRRIIRALEVSIQASLQPPSAQEKEESLESLGYQPIVIGLTKDRQELYGDIEKRVDLMFRNGLLVEVKKLMKQKLARTALQAVGYKEVIGFLKGEYSQEEAVRLVKRNTRHLAKRQWTWFKKEQGIQWIAWDKGAPVSVIGKQVLSRLPYRGYSKK